MISHDNIFYGQRNYLSSITIDTFYDTTNLGLSYVFVVKSLCKNDNGSSEGNTQIYECTSFSVITPCISSPKLFA